MTIRNKKWQNTALVCLLTATLSACSESDLVELNDQAFEDGIASAGVPAAATPAGLDVSSYELVFSDEFNGSSLDEGKWITAPLSPETVIYEQLQYYVDTQDDDETLASPFTFDGDNLVISASPAPSEQQADANGQSYLSGLITTRERYDMRYGYLEARVKLTQGRGIWPAIWMLGTETDKLRPEVYVLEYDGSKPDSAFHNYNYVDEQGDLRSPGQQEVSVAGFSEGFHTIGLRWSEDELLFFIDGRASWRIIGDNVPAEDMHLIINLAMGGVWPGAPDATTPDPAQLTVDYVRIYQLKEPG